MRPAFFVSAALLSFACAQDAKSDVAATALASATRSEPKPDAAVTVALRHEPENAKCVADPTVPCAAASHWVVEMTWLGADAKKPLRFTADQATEIEAALRTALAAAKKEVGAKADTKPEVGVLAPARAPFALLQSLHDLLEKIGLERFHVALEPRGKPPVDQCVIIALPRPASEPRSVEDAILPVPVVVEATGDRESRCRLGRRVLPPGAKGATDLLALLKEAKNDRDRLGVSEAEFLVSAGDGVTWASVVAVIDIARTAGFPRIAFGEGF